jgi:hypothetical protein
MTARLRAVTLALSLAIGLCGTRSAWAFCRATTCDPTMPADGCMTDAQNCLTVGMPLFWASSCVTVSVQAAGAPKQHIDYNTALGSVTRAFAAWTSASCGGAAPSISVAVNGPITCAASEYNSDRGNANIVVFREDSWPYVGGQDALGLTRLRFDPASGEIWDSDIEVNAVDEPFSVGDATPGAVDLDSLLTHEAGHLLGLAHNTQDQTATMYPGYQTGTISLRTLAKDDIAGVCAIYPPTRQASTSSCEPRHGYSDLCGADQPAPVTPADDQKTSGCSFSRTPRGTGLPVSALFGLAAIVLLKRKRR